LHIVIDGYNVIGTLHNDIEKAREGLIDLLIKYKKFKEHDITVVFDAYKQGGKYEHSSFRGGVRIIYTRLGETADDVIKMMISGLRREWIIVTSDRDIIKYAWSMNSIPVPSDVFLDILLNHPNEEALIEDMKDTEELRPQRGSSYRLSKKDRAVKRVLSKL